MASQKVARTLFVIPGLETVSQLYFCHSVQAKRDTESSIFIKFWMPAFAGMTALMALSAITTQFLDPESRNLNKLTNPWTPAGVYPALDAGPR